MRKYRIEGVIGNDQVVYVSVAKGLVEIVREAISRLPFVDRATDSRTGETRIQVIFSDLYETSDMKELEEVLQRITGSDDGNQLKEPDDER